MSSRQHSSPPDSQTLTPTAPDPLPRKRKYATFNDNTAASSPAPSEAPNETGVVTADVQASSSRPRLTVAREPIFVPLHEGSEFFTTDHICVNRLGFRYIPAGISEPGKTIPYRTIESWPPGHVRVSWEDRSPFVRVSKDGSKLLGDTGYRSARCNVPVREGKWYMEVKVQRGGGVSQEGNSRKQGAHVRLGWGRREAPLNGPVGMDGYSYGYRDSTGEKVTLSRPRPYGQSFGSGDVIGLYISLPPRPKPNPNDRYDPSKIHRERIAIEFKGQEYFESIEYAQTKEMSALMDYANKSKSSASLPSTKKSATVKNLPDRNRNNPALPESAPLRPLPILPGSQIAFFVNGVSQGVAFRDLYDYVPLRSTPSSRKDQPKRKLREGAREHKENHFDDGTLGYFPFISLFNAACISLNAGPEFDFEPPGDIDAFLAGDLDAVDTKKRTWRPLSERYREYMEEQWAQDEKEEQEARNDALPPPPPPPVAPKEQTEQDMKAAIRKEKKRISEQKRRAKKAEEAKLAKSKLEMVSTMMPFEDQQSTPHDVAMEVDEPNTSTQHSFSHAGPYMGSFKINPDPAGYSAWSNIGDSKVTPTPPGEFNHLTSFPVANPSTSTAHFDGPAVVYSWEEVKPSVEEDSE